TVPRPSLVVIRPGPTGRAGRLPEIDGPAVATRWPATVPPADRRHGEGRPPAPPPAACPNTCPDQCRARRSDELAGREPDRRRIRRCVASPRRDLAHGR